MSKRRRSSTEVDNRRFLFGCAVLGAFTITALAMLSCVVTVLVLWVVEYEAREIELARALSKAKEELAKPLILPTLPPRVMPTPGPPTWTPSPAPTDTPSPVPTLPEPTWTPIPTATPESPTSTPVLPTETPTLLPTTTLPLTNVETPTASALNCDPSYPSLCIPPNSSDLNCDDVGAINFPVLPPDPHGFDGNHNGIGCES